MKKTFKMYWNKSNSKKSITAVYPLLKELIEKHNGNWDKFLGALDKKNYLITKTDEIVDAVYSAVRSAKIKTINRHEIEMLMQEYF